MQTLPCPHCGLPVSDQARFCSECGKTIADAPAAEARQAARAKLNQTMLQGSVTPFGGSPAVVAGPAPSPPRQEPPPEPEAPRAKPLPSAAQTMFGMPATSLTPAAPEAQPPAEAPRGPMAFPSAAKTMLGVAVPGLPPGQAGAPPPAGVSGGPKALPSQQGTLLGIAATPAVSAGRKPVPFVTSTGLPAVLPAPAPLVHAPLPAAPRLPEKRGVPAVAVVAAVMALLLAASAVLFLLVFRGGAPLTAQPQLDEGGRESLKLTCSSCPDGTRATLGAKEATFAAGAATLPLPAPLSIGENALVVHLDRPGAGRDEDVKMAVPVAYRVRADLTTASTRPAAITVRVEAAVGSTATVDGKPLALDADGKGAYALDIAAETEGQSRTVTSIERTIPFVIEAKGGKTEKGELKARVGVVPMQLDAPGSLLYTTRPTAPVAGQTKAGATVTVAGGAAPVDAEGRFGVRAELPAQGTKVLEIVAASPPLAPRVVRAKIVRVASLEAAAKELEQKTPLAYAAFGADPKAHTGKDAAVEGEVVEVRSGTGYAVLLVDDKRSCASTSCLVRVVHGEETTITRGARVRAYGRLSGVVSASGRSVPEIEASLLVPATRGRP